MGQRLRRLALLCAQRTSRARAQEGERKVSPAGAAMGKREGQARQPPVRAPRSVKYRAARACQSVQHRAARVCRCLRPSPRRLQGSAGVSGHPRADCCQGQWWRQVHGVRRCAGHAERQWGGQQLGVCFCKGSGRSGSTFDTRLGGSFYARRGGTHDTRSGGTFDAGERKAQSGLPGGFRLEAGFA